MARNRKRHPGFTAVSERIARRERISEKRARAILSASTRRASKRARLHNPYLDNVLKKRRR